MAMGECPALLFGGVMNRTAALLFSLVILSPIAVCADATPRIVNGLNASVAAFPVVAKLEISKPDGDYLDTGTLISPIHIITAGHSVTDDLGIGNVVSGTVILNGETRNVVRYYVHPTWNGQFAHEDIFDVSILELDSPITSVEACHLFHRAPATGSIVTIAGYGELVLGQDWFPPDGTIQWGVNSIDDLTPTFINCNRDNSIESITGAGDSGGPYFLSINGAKTLVGVHSFGSAVSFGGTRMDKIVSWVESITNYRINTAPEILSHLTASESPALSSQPVTMFVSAQDLDGDRLTATWDFGDGTMGSGGSPVHTYSAPGTYAITVTVDDGFGGTDSKTASLTVLPFIEASVLKKKFALNFKTSYRDTFDITVFNAALVEPDKQAFMSAGTGDVVFKIGSATIDTAHIFKGRGRGVFGTCQWKNKTGQIHYTIRNTNLADALGLTNSTVSKTIKVPVRFQLPNGLYCGGTYSFSYAGTKDKNGRGF